MKWPLCFPLWAVCGLWVLLPEDARAQRLPRLQFEDPPIRYSESDVDNVVSRLQAQIDTQTLDLAYGDECGYLCALLEVLDVPVSSQMLTFLKSSLQRPLISPENARAIFFGDNAYVGYVPGGFIELIMPDAAKGLVFYSLEQDHALPKFQRQVARCMTCHSSSRTANVPGLQIRSMLPDPKGQPVLSAGNYRTTQSSPFSQRWGGWYVTGQHGAMKHRGNFTLPSNKRPKQPIDNSSGQNLTDLPDRVDLSNYPATGSDIVALMVFEHQIDAHNLMVRTKYAWQIDQHFEQTAELKKPTTWQAEADRLVRHLTFVDELPLEDTVQGVGVFNAVFVSQGPFDSRGRSLREFDLKRQLFRFPCSYTLHTELFAQLPEEVRVYTLREISEHIRRLLGKKNPSDMKRWSREDLLATLEMLSTFFGTAR